MNEDYWPGWLGWGENKWYERRYVTTTSNTTTPNTKPLTEEDVRRIVREEMADLVKPDIPDAPPADM
jgi:hypothetical protein